MTKDAEGDKPRMYQAKRANRGKERKDKQERREEENREELVINRFLLHSSSLFLIASASGTGGRSRYAPPTTRRLLLGPAVTPPPSAGVRAEEPKAFGVKLSFFSAWEETVTRESCSFGDRLGEKSTAPASDDEDGSRGGVEASEVGDRCGER
jgi:hypothetical protein